MKAAVCLSALLLYVTIAISGNLKGVKNAKQNKWRVYIDDVGNWKLSGFNNDSLV